MSIVSDEVEALARLFKALGDETRLRIVALLADGEQCVCHIQAALDVPQPNVSRHLASLRAAGVVADRREGSWIHYSLKKQTDPEREAQLRALVRSFAGLNVRRNDCEEDHGDAKRGGRRGAPCK